MWIRLVHVQCQKHSLSLWTLVFTPPVRKNCINCEAFCYGVTPLLDWSPVLGVMVLNKNVSRVCVANNKDKTTDLISNYRIGYYTNLIPHSIGCALTICNTAFHCILTGMLHMNIYMHKMCKSQLQSIRRWVI